MEKLIINGRWRFNLSEGKAYSGTLTLTNNDIDLDIIDCDDYREGFFNVFGFSDKGKKITLYKCFVTEHKCSTPGLPSLKLTANYYFEGEHLNDDQLYFDSALFTFNSLDRWLDISGFTNEINPDDENGIIIKYKNQQSLTFFSNVDIKLSFEFQATWPVFTHSHEINLVQKTKICLVSKKKFDLVQLWIYLSQLRGFFTLAYYSQPRLEELELLIDEK